MPSRVKHSLWVEGVQVCAHCDKVRRGKKPRHAHWDQCPRARHADAWLARQAELRPDVIILPPSYVKVDVPSTAARPRLPAFPESVTGIPVVYAATEDWDATAEAFAEPWPWPECVSEY